LSGNQVIRWLAAVNKRFYFQLYEWLINKKIKTVINKSQAR